MSEIRGPIFTVRSLYYCPDCDHHWSEDWDCDCNGECPECETSDMVSVCCFDLGDDGEPDRKEMIGIYILDSSRG